MNENCTFTKYKEKIMTMLLENTTIVQALANNEKDFIENPISIKPTSLMYKNIYPYKISPKILTSPTSLIILGFNGFRQIGRNFKGGTIQFYIISHMSLIRTNSGLRYDVIYEELQKIIETQALIGIGKLELGDVSDLVIDENYIGCSVFAKVVDFK